MVQEAIGDEADFPDMTSDPRVNHAVDMIVCGESSWEKLSDKDREIYQEEAKTAQAEGL
jgi:TRAP-type C4-dicarboxylate transport system substrate-binding protein